MYINVGARYTADGSDIPTKTKLKVAFRDNPGDVVLYGTSMGETDKLFNADNMDIGVKYSVTGPNPYTSRKWYATVEKLPNGAIKVS